MTSSSWVPLKAMVIAVVSAMTLIPAIASSPDGKKTVSIKPQDNIQAVVDANAAGTAYVLTSGVYRLQSIVPKDGDVFDGDGKAVLSGSRLLTEFTRKGSVWLAGGQTQEGQIIGAGECQSGFPRCDRPEDLYIDDIPMRHVDSLGRVGPGRWYFDYAADTVFLGDNPEGRKVEISVTPRAFGGKAKNVVIRNLIIEKYATPLQMSAVDAEFGDLWAVEGNVIRWNHAVAVNAGPNSRIMGNKLQNNGQQGFDGAGNNYVIAGNEIAHNNFAGVNYKWEAGGGKVTQTFSGSSIRGNCVHGNDGPGIWADEGVRNLLIEDNVVFDNGDNGIMYEISYDGVIRNNIVANNGKKGFRWFWGPQILVSSSRGVQVYGNTIDVPEQYGHAITVVSQDRKPYTPAINNDVRDNVITLRGTSSRMAVVTDVRADAAAVVSQNVMRRNVYHVADLSGSYWQWGNKRFDWNGIQRLGQESESKIDAMLPKKPPLDCAFLGLR